MSDSQSAAREFTRLLEVVARLRAPDGCPWDREQTIDSLKPFVLEETYEVLEAIDRQDHKALCEELGDFLFEAVFLAQMESEAGEFAIADALRSIADKLVRRHPHVFERESGEPALGSAREVRARWEEIKAKERDSDGTSKTLLGGIPAALPSLLRAYRIGLRASSVGFDWTNAAGVVEKVEEELAELREALAEPSDMAHVEEEMGDLLFSIANLARKLGIEPETALRKANEKFTDRFVRMDDAIKESGRAMREMTLDELEAQWQRAKAESSSRVPRQG